MNTIEIEGTKITLEFPESGLEFERRHFLSLSKWMLYYNAAIISFQEFKTKLVYDFLNLKRTADTSKVENLPVIENILAISKLVDAYFTDEKIDGKMKKVLHMDHYRQLLPELVVDGKKFFGPLAALFNTKYGEYMQALTAFIDYSLSGEEAKLDRLIATLYRPEKRNNHPENPDYRSDIRETFNPELTDHYSQALTKLLPEVKHAIYLYFASCQHFIANSTSLPIGGGVTVDLSILFKKTANTSDKKGVGMAGTLFAIAESKVFGSVKDVAEQNTYDVLVYLVDQQLKMKELKKKK